MIATVGDLIEKLQEYSTMLPVHIEGYAKGTENENRGYDVVDVEGWKNEDGRIGVTIYGRLREPSEQPDDESVHAKTGAEDDGTTEARGK